MTDLQNQQEPEAAPAPAAPPVSLTPARVEPEPWYEPIDPQELEATTVAAPTVLTAPEEDEPAPAAKAARARRPRQPTAKTATRKTATKTAAKRASKAKATPASGEEA